MQLFNALLAGVFAWLMLYTHRRKTIARQREWAGELLVFAKAIYRRRSMWWLQCSLGVAFLMMLVYEIVHNILWQQTSFTFYFIVAIQIVLMMQFLFPMGARTAIEVREHGLLLYTATAVGNIPASMIPWDRITCCKWSRNQFSAPHSECVLLPERLVSPNEYAAVTAAIARVVPVFDYYETLLAEPKAEEYENRKQHTIEILSWFQFDLQTMFILMVVVACLANCYSLGYRTTHPQNMAVEKWERAFQPSIFRHGVDGDVKSLDFSSSTPKPTDADLNDLIVCSELTSLDLTDAPVTDAIIENLQKLKQLTRVRLTGTAVTDAGVKRLHEALPAVSIYYGPSNNSKFIPGTGKPSRIRN
jgi:hypothetical protein